MLKKIQALIAKVKAEIPKARKSLAAGVAVAVTIEAFAGTPTNVKAWIANVLAVLVSAGVVHQLPNAA